MNTLLNTRAINDVERRPMSSCTSQSDWVMSERRVRKKLDTLRILTKIG